MGLGVLILFVFCGRWGGGGGGGLEAYTGGICRPRGKVGEQRRRLQAATRAGNLPTCADRHPQTPGPTYVSGQTNALTADKFIADYPSCTPACACVSMCMCMSACVSTLSTRLQESVCVSTLCASLQDSTCVSNSVSLHLLLSSPPSPSRLSSASLRALTQWHLVDSMTLSGCSTSSASNPSGSSRSGYSYLIYSYVRNSNDVKGSNGQGKAIKRKCCRHAERIIFFVVELQWVRRKNLRHANAQTRTSTHNYTHTLPRTHTCTR